MVGWLLSKKTKVFKGNVGGGGGHIEVYGETLPKHPLFNLAVCKR